MAAARHAGVGQFIDQHHRRTSSQHLVHVELVEDGPSVAGLGEGNLLQRGEHGLGIRAVVGLDQPHDHIHSPLSQALGLGQHGVGLSGSGSNTEIDAQPTSARRRCRTRRHSAAHRDHPSLPHVGSNLQLAKGAHEGQKVTSHDDRRCGRAASTQNLRLDSGTRLDHRLRRPFSESLRGAHGDERTLLAAARIIECPC